MDISTDVIIYSIMTEELCMTMRLELAFKELEKESFMERIF
jgi:hypothetical protein